MMDTLRCDHPDILAFVDAKRDDAMLRRFNLSVLVSDAFLRVADEDAVWPLLFSAHALGRDTPGEEELLMREWPGERGPVDCRVLNRIPARELWSRIMRATYE